MNPFILLEEFFTGLTVDQNLANLVKHFAETREQPVFGKDFWSTEHMTPKNDFEAFYRQNPVIHSNLAEPSYGDYKLPFLNF